MTYRRRPCPVCRREVCHVSRHLRRHPGAYPVAFPRGADPTPDAFLMFLAAIVERERRHARDGRVGEREKISARVFLLDDGLAALLSGMGVDVGAFHASVVGEWMKGNGK